LLFAVVLTEIYVIKWLRITQRDDLTQKKKRSGIVDAKKH